MNTVFMLLAIYDAPVLTLDQVCEVVGVDKDTAYVKRSNGTFPVPMYGKPLRADVRDVAEYMDKMRAIAV
jgi:predicted DNA-binding transcriptional regulator AlpA